MRVLPVVLVLATLSTSAQESSRFREASIAPAGQRRDTPDSPVASDFRRQSTLDLCGIIDAKLPLLNELFTKLCVLLCCCFS